MHFFIDQDTLSTQLPEDAFGPDSIDPSTKYNVTSKFQLSQEAKVFAVQGSTMIVQQSDVDPTLVNLLLKPCFQDGVIADIQYYVYRGVLKSSLISGNDIVVQAANNNELISRIWDESPTDTSFGTIGFDDNSLSGSTNVEDILNNTHATVKSIYVKEGEWIGSFSTTHKIGFEVILRTNRFVVDLTYVRGGNYVVDTTGFVGFALQTKREEILNFLDPAAFFGLHSYLRVRYSEYNPDKVVKITSANRTSNQFIYNKLLSNFYTSNKVYLDIRSEKGYSYNLYENYDDGSGNSLRIKYPQDVNPIAIPFSTNSWPIITLQDSQPSQDDNNSVFIQFRVDDNLRPIVFIPNTFFKHRRRNSKYIKGDEINTNVSESITETDWSKEIRFNFLNEGTGTNRNNVANIIQLYYFRQEHNASAPVTVLRNEKYYDSAFCSIDIPNLGETSAVFKETKSSHPIYIREPLDDVRGTGNFGMTMNTGAFWDNRNVLFYSRIGYEYTAKTSEKEFINTFQEKLNLDSGDYRVSQLLDRTDIICRSYSLSGQNIRIPSINFYKSIGIPGADVGKNHKENLMLLGLSLDELASIKSSTSLNAYHDRYIHLEPDANNPFADNDSKRYFKYTLQLQGMLLVQNTPQIVTPTHNGNPITVYSRDNQFFSSRLFSENINVTTGIADDIEFYTYENGCIKINDNIDFALIRGVQNLYFKYKDSNNLVTDVFNAAIEMTNKMERRRGNNGEIPNIPAGFTQTEDYTDDNVPGVDATFSYQNDSGDVVTEGNFNIRRYNNKGKKKFLVRVVTSSSTAGNGDLTNFFENQSLGFQLEYRNTLRLYANPLLTAAVIGALVQFNEDVICQGFAYIDGSCYPSAEHVNGEALDTDYFTAQEDNVNFILALNAFGFKRFRIGNDVFHDLIYEDEGLSSIQDLIIQDENNYHDGHLHSTDVAQQENCSDTL
ncbi:hypothetical protein [Ulvibacterium sp.]|uniref:hypothetical protein n=1 Tax=Ulvibacterium sp. TaxID=2665914 RepID=UPI003BAB76A0